MLPKLPVRINPAEFEKQVRELPPSLWWRGSVLAVTEATYAVIGSVSDLPLPVAIVGAVFIGLSSFFGSVWIERKWQAFHTVPIQMLSKEVEGLRDQLRQHERNARTQVDKARREDRKIFEAKHGEYRNDLSPFLMTLANLLVKQDRRHVSRWAEYLPSPPDIDGDFYCFAFDLWTSGWSEFGNEGNFETFKVRFRRIYEFFNFVYAHLTDHPEDADYFNETFKPYRYHDLHVVWYLAHALGDSTYGAQRKEMPLPGWHKLWCEWNTKVSIPNLGPIETFEDADQLLNRRTSPAEST